ncbi:MAG TPA: hypothetical protein VFV13_06675 [Acidimicrobiia bacterium]|nr:hypothetical protein [Acidimicrobiia bacterium]
MSCSLSGSRTSRQPRRLVALIPIATVASAHFLVAGERFNPRSIPGLVLSLLGTALLVGLGGSSLEAVGNLWRGSGCR